MSGCSSNSNSSSDSILSEHLVLEGDDVSLVLEGSASLSPDSGVATGTDVDEMVDGSEEPSTLSLSSSSDLLTTASPSVTISPSSLASSSLILTEDHLSNELTVCQYLLPTDIVVGGFEEVVEEVDLGSQWSLSNSCVSTVPSSTTCCSDQLRLITTNSNHGEQLQLITTSSNQGDQFRFISTNSGQGDQLRLVSTSSSSGDHLRLITSNGPEDQLQLITTSNGPNNQLQLINDPNGHIDQLRLLTSTSPNNPGDQLQLLASPHGAGEDILFTVVEDTGEVTTSQLNASNKDHSSTIFDANDMIVEKYYQYTDDMRLVQDIKLESVVQLSGGNRTTLNGAVLSSDDECLIKEEFVGDVITDDTSHFTVIESNKLNDMVSDHVIEMADDPLHDKSGLEQLGYTTSDDLTDVSGGFTIPNQINDFSAYPNIVLGYVDGGIQNGKTVRLKVHKINRSDKTIKDDGKKSSFSSIPEEPVRCIECDIDFKKSDDLKAHMEAHLVKLQNSCVLCSLEFPSKSALQAHIRQHFTKSQACNLCSERFANKSLLRTHKLRKHSINASTITSSSKSSISVETSTFRDTIRTVTTTVRSTNANASSHKAVSTTTLSSSNSGNVSSNSNVCVVAAVTNNGKDFKCSLCKMVFSSRSELKQHSTSHFQKPYKCDQCGATFTQNGSLQVHIRRHRGEKPFTCDLCGNSYTRAFSLKVHMKTHTGEKPHTCEYCSSSFITSSHLNVHRRIHTGERPFSCPECSATFITTSHLNVHKRIHLLNASTPVRCAQCNVSFRDNTQLRLHRKAHHSTASAGGGSKKRPSTHPATCRCKQCSKSAGSSVRLGSKTNA